jgi:hypothetical protein
VDHALYEGDAAGHVFARRDVAERDAKARHDARRRHEEADGGQQQRGGARRAVVVPEHDRAGLGAGPAWLAEAVDRGGELAACTPETCAIVVDSEDEIGESAMAFKRLVEALSASVRIQLAVRSFSEILTSQLEIGGPGRRGTAPALPACRRRRGSDSVRGGGRAHGGGLARAA